MKTMKDITNCTNGQEYANSFWNAMKFDASSAVHIEDFTDKNTGAYMMPNKSESEFRAFVAEKGTVRKLATVYEKYDGSSSVWAYESDDYADFVGEGETIPGFDVKDDFTEIKVNAFKLASLAKLSCEFVYDARFDIEKYIRNRIGKAFAKSEDKAFINGNGTTEPMGILHETKGAKTADTIDNLTYDSCIDLFFSVKPEYRKNAVWLMNDNTALALRKLKDENGNYLWNCNNDTILGKPVVICNEMPDAEPGEKPLAFGDMSYYRIIDRSPVSIKPLKELYAESGQVAYIGYERLDGRLIRSEAVKVIRITEEE